MSPVIRIIEDLLNLYIFVIIIQAVLSWFPDTSDSALGTVKHSLYILTEPVYRPLRRAIPGVGTGGMQLDLSPFIVLITIEFILKPLFAAL